MIPFFLRRFGAALICSLALTLPVAPPALATDAGDAATAKPQDAAPGDAATAKPQDAKPGDKVGKVTPAEATARKKAAAGVPESTLRAREEAEREGRRHGARKTVGDGTLLVWDNVNSVWIATEPKDTYWVDDTFYRYDGGVWLRSGAAKGPWELTASDLVPDAPRGRHGDPKKEVSPTLPSGVEAHWDPKLKAFKVAGRKGVFLVDAAYYRYDGGVWLESASPEGPWKTASAAPLPPALRRALPAAKKGDRVTLPGGDVLVSEGQPNLFGVEGRPNVLYFDGTFYERRDEKWMQAASLASEWEESPAQKVPGPVRSNYHKKDDKKSGKDKGGDKKNADRKAAANEQDGASGDGDAE
jgi:hypothetical protein